MRSFTWSAWRWLFDLAGRSRAGTLLPAFKAIPALLLAAASNGTMLPQAAADWDLRPDRQWSQAIGWTVYWSVATDRRGMSSHTCLAEQTQASGTRVVIGISEDAYVTAQAGNYAQHLMGRRLVVAFHNDETDASLPICDDCTDRPYEELIIDFDGRAEASERFAVVQKETSTFLSLEYAFDGRTGFYKPGTFTQDLILIPIKSHEMHREIAASDTLRLIRRKDERQIAEISLKGSAAALQTALECFDDRSDDFSELVRSTSLVRQALDESSKASQLRHYGEKSAEKEAKALGHYRQAEALLREAIAIRQRILGEDHQDVGPVISRLAQILEYVDKSQSVAAALEQEELRRQALSIAEADKPDDPGIAPQLVDQAVALARTGDFAGAVQLFDRWLSIVERELDPQDYEGERNHPEFQNGFFMLDFRMRYEAVRTGDRTTHAARLKLLEPLFQRLISIFERKLGRETRQVAMAMTNLASLQVQSGRPDRAIELFRQARAIQEKVLGTNHPETANSLGELGKLLVNTGDVGSGEPQVRRAVAIFEKRLESAKPGLELRIARTYLSSHLEQFADVARISEKAPEAVAALRRALLLRETNMKEEGRYDSSIPRIRLMLARALLDDGEAAEALEIARALSQNADPRRAIHLRALNEVTGKADLPESFTVVQRTGNSAAGAALSRTAARFSAGEGELARMIRTEQNLVEEITVLERKLIVQGAQQGSKPDNSSRDRLRQATRELEELRQRLEAEFPEYAELSKPAVLTIEEVQSLLGEDEALVVIDIATADGGGDFVWALTADLAGWERLDTRDNEVAEIVARLREGLDRSVSNRRPIDPGLANRLYAKLLGPVETIFNRKKHLIFVLNGPISSLPPHVLAVQPPTGTGFAGVDWLARHFAVTVMPTVSSLKLLRDNAGGLKAPKAFRGYGDPVFNADREGSSARMARRGYRAFFGDTVADVDLLRRALPRLPGTGVELKAVAASLGVPESEIILREAATESAVKRDSLDQYDIVYFATHGLVAGEVGQLAEGNAEPALALTVPKEASTLDDGLLTASEIAQLKLNADWVVLSACNTAAEGELGADALSGLARAFFHAGARSLLVSHWVVDDLATAELMKRTFAHTAQVPEDRAAESLRTAMVSLMQDAAHPEWADPVFWAPFIIVGEPD